MTRCGRYLCVAILAAAVALPAPAQTVLKGAGTPDQLPVYSKWFSGYHAANPRVEITYAAVGSGHGMLAVMDGMADFAASEGPMTNEDLQTYRGNHGFDILHVPALIEAVVPTYNIRGLTQELNFTPEALAGILLRKITNWNDPVIANANRETNLPDLPIVVVHRSGGRTNHVWSDYLCKASPEWKSIAGAPDDAIKWPAGFGLSANEDDEVVALMKLTDGSIGFLNFPYVLTTNLAFGRVRNPSGAFVKADLASLTAAAASSANGVVPTDSRLSITNAPGKSAYPIANFAWLLVPGKAVDSAKKHALVGFLRWAMADGQSFVEPVGFAKLPPQVVTRVKEALAQIQ